MDKGTLWQLRNILHRTSVPKDPTKNVKGAEDFLQLVLTSYVISAANAVLSTCPGGDVNAVSEIIVSSFCTLSKIGNSADSELPVSQADGIQAYSKEVCHFVFLHMHMHATHMHAQINKVNT